MRQGLFALSVLVAVPAWGATNTSTPVTLSQVAVRTVVAAPGTSSTWAQWAQAGLFPSTAAGSPLGTVVAQTIQKGPSPKSGEVIDVAVKRVLPWSSISKAVAKSLPLISTAIAIKEIADAIRCREAVGGAAECDPGTVEVSAQVFCVSYPVPASAGHCGATKVAAASAYSVYLNANVPTPVASGTQQSCSSQRYQVGGTTTSPNIERSTFTSTGGCSFAWGSWSTFTGLDFSSSTQLACPSVVVNGVTLVPVKGPDGKCATNIYQPASEVDVATKAETWGDKAKAPLIVGDLNAAGKPIDHPFPTIDPVPDSVIGPRETTTSPDGSTTVRDTRYDLSPTPTGYEWTPVTTTKSYPPGAVIPPPGAVTDGTTTTGSAPKEESITCGLPGTPPCKIDETGTPSTATIPTQAVDTAKGSALGKITELGSLQAPAWSWSFSLPSVCMPITVGPFLSQSVTVDLCAYQPMIHDLVSLIWAAFTVWACIGMVGRTFATG